MAAKNFIKQTLFKESVGDNKLADSARVSNKKIDELCNMLEEHNTCSRRVCHNLAGTRQLQSAQLGAASISAITDILQRIARK